MQISKVQQSKVSHSPHYTQQKKKKKLSWPLNLTTSSSTNITMNILQSCAALSNFFTIQEADVIVFICTGDDNLHRVFQKQQWRRTPQDIHSHTIQTSRTFFYKKSEMSFPMF